MPRLLKKSWLDSFVEYVEDVDKEIPLNFIIWSGLSLISSSSKSNTYIYYKGNKIPPNQYIVLTAPPGIGKGSIIKPAIELGKEAGTVNYIEDKVSPEKLIELLAEGQLKTLPSATNPLQGNLVQDHTGCVASNELSILLNNSENMHSYLCALWDQKEFSYSTKHKGNFKAQDLCFSLLSGCTPDYLRNLVKDKLAHITSGFTARCVFVFAHDIRQPEDMAFGKPSAQRGKLYDELVNDLRYISTLNGEIKYTDDAQRWWSPQYKKLRTNSNGSYYSDAYANFHSRRFAHILKTSLAISLSENDSLTVTEHQLKTAAKYIDEVESTVDIVFKYTGESPITVSLERVEEYIRAKGPCTRAKIMEHNRKHMTDEQLTTILRSLEVANLIHETRDTKGRITFEWTGA